MASIFKCDFCGSVDNKRHGYTDLRISAEGNVWVEKNTLTRTNEVCVVCAKAIRDALTRIFTKTGERSKDAYTSADNEYLLRVKNAAHIVINSTHGDVGDGGYDGCIRIEFEALYELIRVLADTPMHRDQQTPLPAGKTPVE